MDLVVIVILVELVLVPYYIYVDGVCVRFWVVKEGRIFSRTEM